MSPSRIDDLAAAWSTGDPDPIIRTKLEDMLRRDPEARRRFLDHRVGEMALMESLSSSVAVKKAGADRAGDDRRNKEPLRLRLRRRTRRPAALPIGLWAGGAAAVLMVGLSLMPSADGVQIAAGSLVADGRTIPSGGRGSGKALAISSTTGGDGMWSQTITVKPFSTYRATAWVKCENITGTGRGVMLWARSPDATSQALTGTCDWQQLSLTFTTTEDATIHISCVFGSWGLATGSAWFDDLTVTEVTR